MRHARYNPFLVMSKSLRAFIDGKPFNMFLGLLAIVIWGYAYIVIRVTVRDNPPTIPPISLAFIRFVIGYAILLLIPDREKKKLGRKENLTIVWMALTGLTFYFYFEHTGLVYTSATNASILISLVPVLTAIGAAVFFKHGIVVTEIQQAHQLLAPLLSTVTRSEASRRDEEHTVNSIADAILGK